MSKRPDLFRFDLDEQTRLMAAFRATRKFRNLPDPTIRECLTLAHQAELMVALCAGINAVLQGNMMIDLVDGELEMSLPVEAGSEPVVLRFTRAAPATIHSFSDSVN